MIPLYGFLQGDTMGLVLVGRPDQTVAELAAELQQSARVRVAPRGPMQVIYRNRVLPPEQTLAQAGMQALDRFDVVEARP